MAIKKVKYHPAGTGHADINHFETDDTMVLMTAGGTLAAKIAASVADYVRKPAYGPAAGAVNAYTFSAMTAATLVDGMSVYLDNVIAANTGAATFNWSGLGAKAIVDAKGAALTAGKMPLNCIIGLRYNASISSFQLLGEGGEYGTALNSDVLNTKTLGTPAGVVAGTMPNNTSPTVTKTSNGDQVIVPAGYNPGGTITVAISNLIAAVIKDATVVGGVTGTYGHEAANPITAGDVVAPHVGFVNGAKITGTLALPSPGAQVYNNAGTYSFTVPSGVTQILFEATGGGGGGGSGGNSSLGGSGAGGGGGAGCYTDFLTVTPGEVLTVIVGAGGNPGSGGGSGSAGGDSSVKANYGRGGGGGNGGVGGVGGGGVGGNGGGYYARSGGVGGQYAGAGGISGSRIASGNGGSGSPYGASSMGAPGTIGNKGYVQIFI